MVDAKNLVLTYEIPMKYFIFSQTQKKSESIFILNLVKSLMIFLTFSFLALSKETLNTSSESEPKCIEFKQISQLAFCLSAKDPGLKEIGYELEAAKFKLDIATQWPNPEINWQFGHGFFLGDEIWQNQVSLMQTFLIGGKNSAKHAVALTENQALELQKELKKMEVLNQILKSFIRLKALSLEINYTSESIQTITQALKIYKSKPRLDPEQITALYLLEMSFHQNESQVAILSFEKKDLLAKLKALSKKEISEAQFEKLILSAKDPQFKNQFKASTEVITLQKKIRQKELEYRKALYDFEIANSWPDLKIGPMINHQWQGSLEQVTYGFNFAFTFPLYNMNGAARANRRALYESYKNTKEVQDTQNEIELETRLHRYQDILDKYQRLPSLSSVESKVKNINSLLKRGLISVPSFMEVRRQTIDYIKSRQEMQQQLFDLYLSLKNDLAPDEKFEIWENIL